MDDRFILAQISDTHIHPGDPGATERMRRAMQQAREFRADAILLTGDLVNDEQPAEYALLADLIAKPHAPLFLMPGNHDARAAMRAAFPDHAYLPREGSLSFVLDQFPLRIVAVDQIVPGETHGNLTAEEAAWLDRTLAAAPERPTIVALHHPPFLTHDMLFDQIGLHQADAFADVIAKHRQVIRIICGHHHRVAVGQVAHAPVVIAPSTSFVYGLAVHPGQQIAPKTDEQPGWMMHIWTPKGGLASHFMGL
ncbi:MAG: metallophosphoesterase [Hyphomonadaceae bacterium]